MLITEAPAGHGLGDRVAGGGAGDLAVGAGHGLERDVERPRARPDAEDADPVLRRDGDRHVAVPCGLVDRRAGERGDVRVAGPLGVREVGGGVDERDQRARAA